MHAGDSKCATALWACSKPATMSHVCHTPSVTCNQLLGCLGLSAATRRDAAMHTHSMLSHTACDL